VRNVTDRLSNPFGMQPPCERFVPGYGDANADFHVIGDHPGVHGAERAAPTDGGTEADASATADTGAPDLDGEEAPRVPFSNAAGLRLQGALAEAGLLEAAGVPPRVERTFLSYLHACVVDGTPTGRDYDDLERFFDAEVRAIAAHVLLPVGDRAVHHVVENYTARPAAEVDAVRDHATEIRGGGWLVMPVREPADWMDDDERRLVSALVELQGTDYRRETDLGRFVPGGDPYFVR
jgi:uracil-DNA glycosylase